MDFTKTLQKLIKANRGRGGGIFQVARAGTALWEGAVGFAAGAGSPAVEPGDTFEIASITKLFTATLVLLAVDAGRLDLDAPLGGLLPAVANMGLLVLGGRNLTPSITVRQLLAQTSGLPDYWSDPPFVASGDNAFVVEFLADAERRWSPLDILAQVPALAPIGAPGAAGFHYADTNYVILGLLLESIEGKPLAAVFRERLLQPLALADTYLSYHEAPPSSRTLTHRYEGKLDLHDRPHQTADWGGGGLISSTRDLARFMFALRGGEILSSASLGMMQSWQPTGEPDVAYGLGAYRIGLDDDAGSLWGHDGHGGAFLYHWPEQGLVLTGTVNQTESDWWPLAATVLAACGV